MNKIHRMKTLRENEKNSVHRMKTQEKMRKIVQMSC